MNVFYTNACPLQSANDHSLVHMRKMIVEYAQLLSSAHHCIDGNFAISGIYKRTHVDHPSTVWVRQSTEHYEWVWFCAMQLCENYTKLTGKRHKTEDILDTLADFPRALPCVPFVAPPAVTDNTIADVIESYRVYMVAKFAEWRAREKPIAVEFFLTPNWI